MKFFERWKARAHALKREVHALALACHDPRTPLAAKLLAVAVVAYALSPIDLIPDFIPILGYVDDLLLLPMGIYFVVKLIPPEVLDDCRKRAQDPATSRTSRWIAAALIVAIWLIAAFLAIRWLAEWWVN